MNPSTPFSKDVLKLDLEATAQSLSSALREAVLKKLKRRGLVVAVSGGIDSACTAALAVRALGPERVFGVLMPERDSSSVSTQLGRALCEKLGIAYEVRDIAPALEAAGCYAARDEAVRSVYADFSSHSPATESGQGSSRCQIRLRRPRASASIERPKRSMTWSRIMRCKSSIRVQPRSPLRTLSMAGA